MRNTTRFFYYYYLYTHKGFHKYNRYCSHPWDENRIIYSYMVKRKVVSLFRFSFSYTFLESNQSYRLEKGSINIYRTFRVTIKPSLFTTTNSWSAPEFKIPFQKMIYHRKLSLITTWIVWKAKRYDNKNVPIKYWVKILTINDIAAKSTSMQQWL